MNRVLELLDYSLHLGTNQEPLDEEKLEDVLRVSEGFHLGIGLVAFLVIHQYFP